MPTSEDLFISELHPSSRRRAVIEDDGRVAWLYLTEPETRKPVADCWLYNRVPTPPRFNSSREEPPVVPQTHAGVDATMQPPSEESVRLQWSLDGESVAVFFDADLIGFIAHGQKHGYSRCIRVAGPFGSPLDTELFQRLFVETQ